jgi:hypothetical protein
MNIDISQVLTGIIIIALCIYVGLVAYSALSKKINESFTTVSTPDEIIKELKNQELLVRKLGDTSVNEQDTAYLPQIDIMKRFSKSTTDMLGNLTIQVKDHTIKKDAELEMLKTRIRDMEIYAANDLVNAFEEHHVVKVKSHNNGLELGLIQPDKDVPSYLVQNISNLRNNETMAQPACLSVSAGNEYDFVPCNLDDPNQKFKLDYVYNDGQYKNKLAPGFPKLDNLGKVRYPFVYVKAASNDNCVKNSHGQLSVEPCREYVGQRWAPVESK